MQAHRQRQAVVGRIDPVKDVIVKRIGRNDAALRQALLQQPLLQAGNKAAKNIPCAEMNPHRRGFRGRAHGVPVIAGQPDLCRFPRLPVAQTGVTQLHRSSSFARCCPFWMASHRPLR